MGIHAYLAENMLESDSVKLAHIAVANRRSGVAI